MPYCRECGLRCVHSVPSTYFSPINHEERRRATQRNNIFSVILQASLAIKPKRSYHIQIFMKGLFINKWTGGFLLTVMSVFSASAQSVSKEIMEEMGQMIYRNVHLFDGHFHLSYYPSAE